MLNAFWIVLLGMVIIFVGMGILLVIIICLDRLTRTTEKKETKG